MMYSPNQDESIDDLDSFKIIQKKGGYRFSADAVLLANFALPLKPSDSVIDMGTGSGVIPLILAQKSAALNIVGIEIQEDLANIAKRNVELNNLSERVKIIKSDFRTLGTDLKSVPTKLGRFSIVVSNPPYTKLASGRISSSSQKAMAKMEFTCTLNDIVLASKCLVAEAGRIVYIYPVTRLREMLSVLMEHKLEVCRLEFVQPEQYRRVKRFLVEAAMKE
jgi:tRNA1(Val) A37 N6-methylase TrmN6